MNPDKIQFLDLEQFCQLKQATRQTVNHAFQKHLITKIRILGKSYYPLTPTNLSWFPGAQPCCKDWRKKTKIMRSVWQQILDQEDVQIDNIYNLEIPKKVGRARGRKRKRKI